MRSRPKRKTAGQMKLALFAGFTALLLGACALIPPFSSENTDRKEEDGAASPSRTESRQEPPDPNFPVTVAGVEIQAGPGRVASLNPSITELIYDLGLESMLVANGSGCTYPEQARALPDCGSEAMPNTDVLAGEQVELALSLNPLPQTALDALEAAGIQSLVLQKPAAIEELPGYYNDLCRALLGEEAGALAAERYAAPLVKAYSAVTEAARQLEHRPLGAFAAFLPLTLATGDSLQGRLLENCGIENAADGYTGWQYPQELLLPFNPEVLVLDSRTTSAGEAAAHPNYKTTPCVTNNRLLELDGSAIENGGRRLYESALAIARLAGCDDLPQTLDAPAGEDAKNEGDKPPDAVPGDTDSRTGQETPPGKDGADGTDDGKES